MPGLAVTVSLPGELRKRPRIRHLIPGWVTLESAVELEAEILNLRQAGGTVSSELPRASQGGRPGSGDGECGPVRGTCLSQGTPVFHTWPWHWTTELEVDSNVKPWASQQERAWASAGLLGLSGRLGLRRQCPGQPGQAEGGFQRGGTTGAGVGAGGWKHPLAPRKVRKTGHPSTAPVAGSKFSFTCCALLGEHRPRYSGGGAESKAWLLWTPWVPQTKQGLPLPVPHSQAKFKEHRKFLLSLQMNCWSSFQQLHYLLFILIVPVWQMFPRELHRHFWKPQHD